MKTGTIMNNISDTLKPSLERYNSSEGALTPTNEGKFQVDEDTDLDLKISAMIEKCDGVWTCKMCGKTAKKYSNIKEHAESHI